MLGNIQSESQITPDLNEYGGVGYGLTQWTPKSKLVDWCNARGLDHRTIDAQCQRIQWEMENNQQCFYNSSRPDIAYSSFRDLQRNMQQIALSHCTSILVIRINRYVDNKRNTGMTNLNL